MQMLHSAGRQSHTFLTQAQVLRTGEAEFDMILHASRHATLAEVHLQRGNTVHCKRSRHADLISNLPCSLLPS